MYLSNFTCCCVGCLHGDEPCSNDVCPDEWQGYSFKRNKFVEPNLDFWFHDREPDLSILRVENVDWATRINEMSSIRTFTDLQVYVNNNLLPEFVCEPKYTMSAAEMENLDLVALHHVPNDAPRNVSPIQIEGDGNCFPRSISYILYKSQNHYMEVRTRIIYETVKNCDKYLDDFYVSRGAVNFYDRGTYLNNMGSTLKTITFMWSSI